jgi:hypothetical protein
VASVKWLTEIEVISGLFSGHCQTETYFFEWQRCEQVVREAISLQRVRSLITEPEPDSEVEQGELPIRGVAWSGAAPIARVEVRIGGGPWQDARLVGGRKRHSWQGWELIARLEQPGPTVISARATDMASRTQPDSPEWNRLGYGNNAIQIYFQPSTPSSVGVTSPACKHSAMAGFAAAHGLGVRIRARSLGAQEAVKGEQQRHHDGHTAQLE